MPNGAPQQLPVGPPADVLIVVLPGVPGGRPSLLCYPRRRGDTKIFFTRQGNTPTPGLGRQVMWSVSGLLPGHMLTLREKAGSPDCGLFPNQPYTINHGQPYLPSGSPMKDSRHGRDSTWAYEIILSGPGGVLASLDPDVEIKDDP